MSVAQHVWFWVVFSANVCYWSAVSIGFEYRFLVSYKSSSLVFCSYPIISLRYQHLKHSLTSIASTLSLFWVRVISNLQLLKIHSHSADITGIVNVLKASLESFENIYSWVRHYANKSRIFSAGAGNMRVCGFSEERMEERIRWTIVQQNLRAP